MKPVSHRRLLLSAGLLGTAMWACPAWSQCDVPKYPSFIGPSPEYAGYAVAIDGDLAVAGAPKDLQLMAPDPFPPGIAYILRRDPESWQWVYDEETLQPTQGQANDYFGRALTMEGDVVVGGAPGTEVSLEPKAGAAYVFRYMAEEWQEVTLTADDARSGDLFGFSLDISGNTVLIGAPRDNDQAINDSGSAYIFEYDPDEELWEQQFKLPNPDPVSNDHFGFSVAIDGDFLAVGVPDDDNVKGTNAGSVRIYELDGDAWIEHPDSPLLPSVLAPGDRFGRAVAIDGDLLVVGAPGDDGAASDEGAAYIYRYSAGNWVLEPGQPIQHSDPAGNDEFGGSVAVSNGNVLAAGGNPHWSYDPYAGADAAYLFSSSGDTWSQQAKFVDAEGRTGEHFGHSVALSGDQAIVGAPFFFVDPNWHGAAYVFDGVDDCNENSVVDVCDILGGTSEDCNWNWLPDECDIDNGTSEDCNEDGTPDECSGDCNNNGIPDVTDICDGTSEDCQPDGIPDECQTQNGVDIIFVIDGSGSIDGAMWALQQDGIINYVCGPDSIVPRDGRATLAVIQFGDDASMSVDPKVINSPADATIFCNDVANIIQAGSQDTFMAPALELALDQFAL
jgi:hypothetical protein